MGLRPYSKVNMESAVTFPNFFVKNDLSADMLDSSSFLNWSPLCSFTFVSTLVAISLRALMFSKLDLRVVGLTRST
jgi:hypothetical protein